jgi:ribosome maturation factor RimP
LTLNDRLEALIAPIVSQLGFVLVRVQMNGRPGALTLQVMAEDPATGQLTLDQCSAISRALDEPLDEADPIEGEYALEVSSPGIDRPLTRAGDWVRWAGHEVRVKMRVALADGKVALKGVVAGLADGAALVEVPGAGRLALPLDEIAGAKLVLTDRLIRETRPLDMAGADETEVEAQADGADAGHD